jgi:integrase/recombinase XerC
MSINNQYLKKHHDTWVYNRRVPKELQNSYQGKSHITKSLGTCSIRQARLHRDKINGEIASLLQRTYSSERIEFKLYLKELRPYAGALKDKECLLDYDDILPRNPIAKAAYRQEVYGDVDHQFTITIKESLNSLLSHKANMSHDTSSKIKNSLNRFLIYLSIDDLPLKDLNKRQVVEYIQHLDCEFAHGTIVAHLSRLRSIWTHAYQMGEIMIKTSPFCDHDLSQYRGQGSKPKQLFSKTQLHQIINECPDSVKDLVRLGLFTGARLSELCTADVEIIEDIKCLVIRKGKTESAVRIIPVPPQVDDIQLPLNLDTKAAGRVFSRFKVSEITDDSTRSFHSLRNHFITASERASLKEFDVAHVVGHKTGTTMSFGHYARHDVKRLAETVNKTADQIEIEWLL